MKQGKTRTMSICLSDIPKDRILKHENRKLYLPLQTYDYDEPDKYDNDFSVSISLNKEEIESKKKMVKKYNEFLLVLVKFGKIEDCKMLLNLI